MGRQQTLLFVFRMSTRQFLITWLPLTPSINSMPARSAYIWSSMLVTMFGEYWQRIISKLVIIISCLPRKLVLWRLWRKSTPTRIVYGCQVISGLLMCLMSNIWFPMQVILQTMIIRGRILSTQERMMQMRLPLGLWKSLKNLHNGNFVIIWKFGDLDLGVSRG